MNIMRNPAGKGMANVATSLKKNIVDLIDERASMLGISRGAMLRNIITNWYEKGCQPINMADNALHRMAAEEPAIYNPATDQAQAQAQADFEALAKRNQDQEEAQ